MRTNVTRLSVDDAEPHLGLLGPRSWTTQKLVGQILGDKEKEMGQMSVYPLNMGHWQIVLKACPLDKILIIQSY